MLQNAYHHRPKNALNYLWVTTGVGIATGCFSLAHGYLDKGQASLLYLPVVIAFAIRIGFGPAVFGALLSFICWDFFFLPPFHTFIVYDPKDWLSLLVFLLAAITTARLASQARQQTEEAQSREAEITTLYQASEAISQRVNAADLLPALAKQLQILCGTAGCLIFQRVTNQPQFALVLNSLGQTLSQDEFDLIGRIAEAAFEHNQVIGGVESRALWQKAKQEILPNLKLSAGQGLGMYVPLQAEAALVGVLYVAPRADRQTFSALEERLILTLANHAAVVIARQALLTKAAQVEALREADVLKNSLLSLVSHELRTPLAAIRASATGLLDAESPWPETMRTEALLSIDKEANRLTKLVSNLLDLSRLEAGAWRPNKDWCDLSEVVGTVLDQMATPDAARVQVTVPDDLPLIKADYIQIALVLTNLLENAAKYTPETRPIQLTLQLTSPKAIKITVRDFGMGLTPGEEEQIFTKFTRGVKHQNSTIHGTGIGLALCKAIVEAHEGRIWAANANESEPKGALFFVTLPVP